MKYCTKCVSVDVSASPLSFDNEGVCTGCKVAFEKNNIDWDSRKEKLKKLVQEYKSDSDYDILIPVSGGKDSYYQTHFAIHELGLKPLLVTYHGNRYLEEGEYNLNRMREVFDCDHIIFRPSTSVLIKLNRLAFKLHGDMNWHNHAGIETFPLKTAVNFKVPLVMWGEHGGLDLSGMFSLKDVVEYTKKYRLEHALHGYDWYDWTDEGVEKHGRPDLKEGLTDKDLQWAKHPTDEEIISSGMRGIYLGNFVSWDANYHVKLVKELYNWQESKNEFERTYRRFSNLDDMHENGIHDYLKFIKFGYGRGTDHACKDIRSGRMTREEGIEMVKKYDHVKPKKDLTNWLNYVDMDEKEFDIIADTFRDKRVWSVENNEWIKENIWGGKSSYGSIKV